MFTGLFARWKKAGRAVGLTGGAGKLAYFDNDGNVVASDKKPSDIDAGGIPSGGTNGQVLTKTSDGPDWEDVPEELPEYTSADNGKVPTVQADGTLAWNTPSGSVPAHTSADDGKYLGVNSQGVLVWATPSGTLPDGEQLGDVLMWWVDGPKWQEIIRIPGDGSSGQFLKSTGGNTVAWSAIPAELPSYSSAENGKVLSVDSSGNLIWAVPSGDVPSYSSSDNGKYLGVNSLGQLVWRTPSGTLPAGENVGDVLMYTFGGPAWTTIIRIPGNGTVGQILKFDGGTQVSWTDVPVELPSYSSADNGKILKVNSSGNLIWATEQTGTTLPSYSSVNNGQVLTVNSSGNLEWDTPSSGGANLYMHHVKIIDDSQEGMIYLNLITRSSAAMTTFADVIMAMSTGETVAAGWFYYSSATTRYPISIAYLQGSGSNTRITVETYMHTGMTQPPTFDFTASTTYSPTDTVEPL